MKLTKTINFLTFSFMMSISSLAFSYGGSGNVYCDANMDGEFDGSDTPMESVTVNVQGNIYGPFTTTTDVIGFYEICIHCLGGHQPDTYDVSLDPSTLDPSAMVVQPASGQYTYELTLANAKFADANFLVNDPSCRDSFCGDGFVDEGEQCDDGNMIDGDGCSAACTIEMAGEGCTPGYWKQEHHFDSWQNYAYNTQFSDVFENAFPGMTLLDVLNQGGGGLKALGRHTVAALLNSQSDGVSYDIPGAAVINSFNAVYPGQKASYESVKDLLQGFNESNCPLN
jgi:cysteine-rich repeat protein